MLTEQQIRDHIRRRIEPKIQRPSLFSLKKNQWSKIFAQLMRNRLVIGALRYETFKEKKENTNHGYDLIGSALLRLQQYQKTGNMEHLVDAANLCMIEFETPSHPHPNWESIDDGLHVERT